MWKLLLVFTMMMATGATGNNKHSLSNTLLIDVPLVFGEVYDIENNGTYIRMEGETLGPVLGYWLPAECWHSPVRAYKSEGTLRIVIQCEMAFDPDILSSVVVQV